MNLYVQQLDPATKKPGKYEYIRIQGDSSKPTVNVYWMKANPTTYGYGTSEMRTSGELQEKQVEIPEVEYLVWCGSAGGEVSKLGAI